MAQCAKQAQAQDQDQALYESVLSVVCAASVAGKVTGMLLEAAAVTALLAGGGGGAAASAAGAGGAGAGISLAELLSQPELRLRRVYEVR